MQSCIIPRPPRMSKSAVPSRSQRSWSISSGSSRITRRRHLFLRRATFPKRTSTSSTGSRSFSALSSLPRESGSGRGICRCSSGGTAARFQKAGDEGKLDRCLDELQQISRGGCGFESCELHAHQNTRQLFERCWLALSKAGEKWKREISDLGCIVCLNEKLGKSPPDIHHPFENGKKVPDDKTIPLCPAHHRTGGFGVALHGTSRRAWSLRFGTERELWLQCRQILGYP